MDLHSGLKIKAFPHCITLPVQLFALGLVPMPPEEKSCFFLKTEELCPNSVSIVCLLC